jgi:hypothetical protein
MAEKMFGDDKYILTLSEQILLDFTLEEILIMNDLTDDQVLAILIDGGLVGEPKSMFEKFEFTLPDFIEE